MSEFISVFQDRQDMLLELIWEHLQISLISLIIAIIIAVPLGLILTRYPRVAEPVIGLSAVMQTIPSLAVLAFLIPFFGIGTTPAIVALTVYGLLPILRNTYTGIKEVNPALKEAATGMGMNSVKRLTKVELPIAMPVMMAGIRTSMVLIVGTTTIAALIGAGGLGELILLGIDRGADVNLILLGAIPAALLAIALDLILRGFERISKKAGFKSFIVMLVIAVLIVTTPFFITTSKNADVVIGGKLGAEPEILINMYKLLIEDETDLEVELEAGLGKTAFVFTALQEESIDIFPEFTGTAIVTHLEEETESNDATEVYEQAKQGMKEEYDMEFLQPMEYNNTYTIATRPETAKESNLEDIGDVKQIEDEITAGFTLEFRDRYDGYIGMQDVYNLDIESISTMDPGIRQDALDKGEVDIIDAYATDSYMVELGLVTLDDPENLFPPYQGAPLLRAETLKEHPELEEVLNQLGGKITDEEMREMNYEVDYEDRSPNEVAREFLESEGLL
ncbi:ABC transporter permease/substrate-binding protein [Virgibacillus sp. NKC19-3]|uniref:ABC transporter permease/substrate-binding protein n=1 Tax=Virgibacillus saliphilus TaxID=2831674 RepID=UPI001C9B33BD|nr:ABC transporter permease/substrate-binding protein [Virgibacillus sp. NKC19-3]MBY7143559.1 ABC transporter permease/substrate-binding protein [Virgibacillus sp. NKC19-3]MBY7145163.1 ABC transporter permease/substrate-binding protein [Virgibacillus sp. NKC19-3]